MIVADTGAIVALLDKDDEHHREIRDLYAADPDGWLLPWAILAEVDYLVARELGPAAQRAWLADLASGAFEIEWGSPADVPAAHALDAKYLALSMGLVDGIVMTIAERLRADIATFDLRHFDAVRLAHTPRLLPRDIARPRKSSGRPVSR